MADRVSTGVEGLDAMLGGGLLPARPYVISGRTGSGKTILGAQFLLDGLRREIGPWKAYALGKIRLKGNLEDLARFRKFF